MHSSLSHIVRHHDSMLRYNLAKQVCVSLLAQISGYQPIQLCSDQPIHMNPQIGTHSIYTVQGHRLTKGKMVILWIVIEKPLCLYNGLETSWCSEAVAARMWCICYAQNYDLYDFRFWSIQTLLHILVALHRSDFITGTLSQQWDFIRIIIQIEQEWLVRACEQSVCLSALIHTHWVEWRL